MTSQAFVCAASKADRGAFVEASAVVYEEYESEFPAGGELVKKVLDLSGS